MRLEEIEKAKVIGYICPYDDERLLSTGKSFWGIGWSEFIHCPKCLRRFNIATALLGRKCVEDTSDW